MNEEEKTLRFGFVREDVLCNPKLSDRAKVVWAGLMLFWMGNTKCWPSQETLAKITGRSRRTLQLALDELVAAQYVEKKRYKYGLIYSQGKAYPVVDRGATPEKSDKYDNLSPKKQDASPLAQPKISPPENAGNSASQIRNHLPKQEKSTREKKSTPPPSPLPPQVSPKGQPILEDWKSIHPLPTRTKESACLKTFEELYRIDGHDWNTIATVTAWIVREKFTYCKSPVKLRKPLKDGTQQTFEFYLWQYQESQQKGAPSNGDHWPLDALERAVDSIRREDAERRDPAEFVPADPRGLPTVEATGG